MQGQIKIIFPSNDRELIDYIEYILLKRGIKCQGETVSKSGEHTFTYVYPVEQRAFSFVDDSVVFL